MAAFKIDDGVVVDSRHLHRSFLRETRPLPQSLHPTAAPLVHHCSQEYHNMSRGTTLPVSSLGLLPVGHRAFLAPLRPWNQRLLAGTVAAEPLGYTAQLVGSLPGYGFVGHRIWCDITRPFSVGPFCSQVDPIPGRFLGRHRQFIRIGRCCLTLVTVSIIPGMKP